MANIIHHMTQSQVLELEALFATPYEWSGEIRWDTPRWIQVLMETAKPDQPLTQTEVDFIIS